MTAPTDPPADGPPDVPDIPRRIGVRQLAGVAVLALLPVVALTGWLDERTVVERQETAALALEVEYPGRTRESRRSVLRVAVTNRSAEVTDVVVMLPEAYLEGFSTGSVQPGPVEAGAVRFRGMGPGEERGVQLELTAERFGRWQGTLRAATSTGDRLDAPVRTLILP
jgi:hypothetical protein